MFRTAIIALALFFTAGAAQAQGAEDRLKKIASTETITIAYRTDAIPFWYTDDKKQVDGFTIDLCKRVVNSIERQIKVPGLQVKWVPVTSRRASMQSPRARPTWNAAPAPRRSRA